MNDIIEQSASCGAWQQCYVSVNTVVTVQPILVPMLSLTPYRACMLHPCTPYTVHRTPYTVHNCVHRALLLSPPLEVGTSFPHVTLLDILFAL
jgi:hypothetical protein